MFVQHPISRIVIFKSIKTTSYNVDISAEDVSIELKDLQDKYFKYDEYYPRHNIITRNSSLV